MVRLLVAALASAVVLFLWGFVYWAVSPVSFRALKAIPNESAVIDALKKSGAEDGTYNYPWPTEAEHKSMSEEEIFSKFGELHKAGPLVQIFYRKDGSDCMSPVKYAMGFVHFFIASLLLAVLLKLAVPSLESYFSRVLFVFLAGLFASVTCDLSPPIWFNHPWCFHLYNALYHIGFGLLGGVVLGAIVKPAK